MYKLKIMNKPVLYNLCMQVISLKIYIHIALFIHIAMVYQMFVSNFNLIHFNLL